MRTQTLVAIDIGSRQHEVVIGNGDGIMVDHFQISHNTEGFNTFFSRVNQHNHTGQVAVAMEGFNGWARPLDAQVQAAGWQLYNVNNLKLARFKEIFPAPAKTDAIDAKRILELFSFQGKKHLGKDVLQAVPPIPLCHNQLKYLSRRRRLLVHEKTLRLTRLLVDLQLKGSG